MDNMTLKIGEKGDLVIGEDGIMQTIGEADTTAQNIRMTLKAGKKDFPLVPEHGTDYGTLFNTNTDEGTKREIYREAIFQETAVAQLNSLSIETEGRELQVSFEAITEDGREVSGSV